jgi:hypothetical protein
MYDAFRTLEKARDFSRKARTVAAANRYANVERRATEALQHPRLIARRSLHGVPERAAISTSRASPMCRSGTRFVITCTNNRVFRVLRRSRLRKPTVRQHRAAEGHSPRLFREP